MPAMRYRSRTFRRVFVRIPGGSTVLRYRRRKNAKAECAKCKISLPGVAFGTKAEVHSIPKSSRTPSRPFGGSLCSACSRKVLIARVRENA